MKLFKLLISAEKPNLKYRLSTLIASSQTRFHIFSLQWLNEGMLVVNCDEILNLKSTIDFLEILNFFSCFELLRKNKSLVSFLDSPLYWRIHCWLFRFQAENSADHWNDDAADGSVERISEVTFAGKVRREVDANGGDSFRAPSDRI